MVEFLGKSAVCSGPRVGRRRGRQEARRAGGRARGPRRSLRLNGSASAARRGRRGGGRRGERLLGHWRVRVAVEAGEERGSEVEPLRVGGRASPGRRAGESWGDLRNVSVNY